MERTAEAITLHAGGNLFSQFTTAPRMREPVGNEAGRKRWWRMTDQKNETRKERRSTPGGTGVNGLPERTRRPGAVSGCCCCLARCVIGFGGFLAKFAQYKQRNR